MSFPLTSCPPVLTPPPSTLTALFWAFSHCLLSPFTSSSPLSKHGSLEEPFPCMLRLSRESGVSTYPLGSLCSVSSSVHCHVLSGLLELYSESPWPHPPCPVQKLPFCLCRALTCPFLFHTAFLTTAWPCPGLFCFGLWFPSSCQLLSLGPSCLADLSPSQPGGPPQGSNQCFAFPRHLLPHKPVTGDVPWFRPCPLHL